MHSCCDTTTTGTEGIRIGFPTLPLLAMLGNRYRYCYFKLARRQLRSVAIRTGYYRDWGTAVMTNDKGGLPIMSRQVSRLPFAWRPPIVAPQCAPGHALHSPHVFPRSCPVCSPSCSPGCSPSYFLSVLFLIFRSSEANFQFPSRLVPDFQRIFFHSQTR